MKRILSLTIAFMIAASFNACGNSQQAQQSSVYSNSAVAESEQSSAQAARSLPLAESGQSSAQSKSSSAVSQKSSSRPKSSPVGSGSQATANNGCSDAMDNVRVKFSFDNEDIIVDMDDNPTSRDFISMLPLTLTFKDYSGSEKISYPPRKLSTQGAPAGSDPSVGDLALFAPWGDIVLYYGDAGYYEGIVKMGHIESGIEKLANRKGDFTVKIERMK